jgi:hypothetical protein
MERKTKGIAALMGIALLALAFLPAVHAEGLDLEGNEANTEMLDGIEDAELGGIIEELEADFAKILEALDTEALESELTTVLEGLDLESTELATASSAVAEMAPTIEMISNLGLDEVTLQDDDWDIDEIALTMIKALGVLIFLMLLISVLPTIVEILILGILLVLAVIIIEKIIEIVDEIIHRGALPKYPLPQ